MKDYYEVLGVERDATADEIKKSFRKLARETHPDANPDDPTAEERFRVFFDVEERLVVVCPGDARTVSREFIAEELSCFEVFELQGVHPATDPIFGESEDLVVRTDAEVTDVEIVMALSHLVDVEEDLFRSAGLVLFAGVDPFVSLHFMKRENLDPAREGEGVAPEVSEVK